MARIETHSGEVLVEEYLARVEMSARQPAQALHVPPNRITEIIRERRALNADTALRLAKFLGTNPRFWLNLQIAHDLSKAQAEGDFSEIRKRG